MKKQIKDIKVEEKDPKLEEFANKIAELCNDYGYILVAQMKYDKQGLIPEIVIAKKPQE